MMNSKGYTIVEAMVSVAVLSFMLIVIYGILQTGNIIYTRDTNLLQMQQQTRNGIDRVARELRQASSQVITTVNANVDRISFNTPASTGIQYFLTGTNLIRQAPNGTTTTVASDISRLKFTLNGTLLNIQVQASKTIYTNVVISFPLTGQVRLRNE
jgi:hypothetical protein